MKNKNNVPELRFPEFHEDGEWEEKKLGGYTTKIGSGITPKGGDKNYTSTGRPFVRSQNIGWGELLLRDVAYITDDVHATFVNTEIKAQDVLLNITGASIGRCARATADIIGGNVNQHVCIIRVKENKLHSSFILQYLLSKKGQKQIEDFQAGGNRQGLNFSQISSLKIPFTKIEEQQKVADCLFSLDNLIHAQTQKLEKLTAHKKGLLQKLFPQEGQNVPEFRFPEFREWGEWERRHIKEVAQTSIGLVTTMTKFYVNNGVKLVRNSDIKMNYINELNLVKLDVDFAEKHEKKKFKKYDIVTVHTGDIGISAVIEDTMVGSLGFATLNTRPNQKIINSYYLCWFYNSPVNIKFALDRATGDGRSNYNLSDFDNAVIPLPSFDEQQKIADCLSSLDSLILQHTKKLDALKKHKQGLMQGLFPSG